MYGLPGFFCNVSDAWLIPRERPKRLWVTIAGGYCDLVLWAVAVLRLAGDASRIARPNYVAWVVASICGDPGVLQLQPPVEARWLLHPERPAGDAEPAEAGLGRLMGHLRGGARGAALGRGAPAAGPAPARLRNGELAVAFLLRRPRARGPQGLPASGRGGSGRDRPG